MKNLNFTKKYTDRKTTGPRCVRKKKKKKKKILYNTTRGRTHLLPFFTNAGLTTSHLCTDSPMFSQSKSLLELSIFMSMAFVKDANGISFKNRLKGHINWHKVRNFIII